MKTKEQVYDDEINPLMAKIIEICKREKIAMVASFRTPNAEDPDLMCTSALLADDFEPTQDMHAAFQIIREGFVAFTRTPRIVRK
jgi:hypothetical protein